MISLQIVFIISFFVSCFVAFYLWQLDKEYQVPGVRWWVAGGISISITSLLLAASVYIGIWARAFGAHLFVIAAFCMFWVGARLYAGHDVKGYNLAFLGTLTVVSSFVIFWFWGVSPNPQVRLTINSVVLLLLSMRIAQTLFLSRIEMKAVTVCGLLYLAFAFVNGFRCIHIIIYPATGLVFMSNTAAKILTFLMVPVLMSVLVSHIFMIRGYAEASKAVED